MNVRSTTILIALLVALSSCNVTNNDKYLARYTSPDGRTSAIITYRENNTTSSDTIHVHIKHKYLPIEIEVGWIYYSPNIQFSWTGNDTLTISNLQNNRYYIYGYPLPYLIKIISVETKDDCDITTYSDKSLPRTPRRF